jgi:tetratricopeptide (TPR) repeat protein
MTIRSIALYRRVASFLLSALLLILCVGLSASSTHAQRVVASWKVTPNAARPSSQFPINRYWDDALGIAQKVGRDVVVFDVDFVDTNSKKLRDVILADPKVQKYLSENFILALDDFSVDPPPTVGFDSLKHLGERLSGFEERYHVVARPAVVIIRPDSTEIDRIPFPNKYTPTGFTTRIKEILAGKNTMKSYIAKFWKDTTSFMNRLALVDQFEERSLYDSVMKHLVVLSNLQSQPKIARRAALKYSYLRLNVEGKSGALRELMETFGRTHEDSTLYYTALLDLLDFYKRRKSIDSVAAFYNRIFAYTGQRDPDMLNDYAWNLATYTKSWDSSLVLIDEALRAKPANPDYLDTRALIEFDLKKYDDALADECKAIEYASEADKPAFQTQLDGYQNQISGKDKIPAPDLHLNPMDSTGHRAPTEQPNSSK